MIPHDYKGAKDNTQKQIHYIMKRHIRLTPEARKQLALDLGVSDSYIYDAIYYRRNGKMAKKIREAAITLGGRYVDPEFVPTCTTEFKDGQIRHTFATGVVLSVDWKTGLAVITEGDKVVWKGENLNFLAQKAQQIVIKRVINA